MPVTNYYSVGGEILGEKTTGGSRIDYLTDALGSVIATVNQSAQVVNTYRFKPYGKQLSKTGAGADPKFTWVGTQGYRQTGRSYSDVHVRARHYDTSTARWTTKDPIEIPIEIGNYYQYASNNPLSLVDPSGLLPEESTSPRDWPGPPPFPWLPPSWKPICAGPCQPGHCKVDISNVHRPTSPPTGCGSISYSVTLTDSGTLTISGGFSKGIVGQVTIGGSIARADQWTLTCTCTEKTYANASWKLTYRPCVIYKYTPNPFGPGHTGGPAGGTCRILYGDKICHTKWGKQVTTQCAGELTVKEWDCRGVPPEILASILRFIEVPLGRKKIQTPGNFRCSGGHPPCSRLDTGFK